jgi:hypothetical protein
MSRLSDPVRLSALKPGDLFFFARDLGEDAFDHTAHRWRLVAHQGDLSAITRDPPSAADSTAKSARPFITGTAGDTLVRKFE